MDEQQIYALERPHPHLLRLYVIRSILSGPFIVLTLPLLLFRYHTLRYRFTDEGVHMRWGFLFRREVNLTYARIQDIHLRSGVVQRWLGFADLLVQTASGSALPEMTIEGFKEYESLRDFFYARMRGTRGATRGVTKGDAPLLRAAPADTAGARAVDTAPAIDSGEFPRAMGLRSEVGGADATGDTVELLREIRDELRRTREALDRRGGR